MGTTHEHANQAKADAIAAGLRRLADMVQQHPEVAELLAYPASHMYAPVYQGLDARTEIEQFVAAARSVGAELVEYASGSNGGICAGFGPVRVHAYANTYRLADEPVSPPPPPNRSLLGDATPGGAS